MLKYKFTLKAKYKIYKWKILKKIFLFRQRINKIMHVFQNS